MVEREYDTLQVEVPRRPLDEEVDRAQAALVTALGGVVEEPGLYA